MRWSAFLPLCLFLATGCSKHTVSPYISPRVTGRVVNARTGVPLVHVQVAQEHRARATELKGGEQLLLPAPVRTDQSGLFAISSEQALTPFRTRLTVRPLIFDLSGYKHLRMVFLETETTNTPAGEPILEVGDIRMEPLKP